MRDYQQTLQAVDRLYQDSAVRDRNYYARFRREWGVLLEKTAKDKTEYFPPDRDAVMTVHLDYGGLDFDFHLDQLKIADWYDQEVRRKKRVVFVPQRLSRSRSGALFFHDSPCHYDPDLPETALKETDRNILAAAMPGLPPELWIVYGNKWVNRKFNPLVQRHLSLFLIQTDYVPAFLGTPFEICLYLFLMDYCIIKADHEKVKDEDLQNYLHIFRPSPMLRIKGLV